LGCGRIFGNGTERCKVRRLFLKKKKILQFGLLQFG
jgi:hypothetical protein